MWKVFRVALQKGCVIRDLRVKPSLISAGGSDDLNTPEGLHSRAVCTATAYQIHGAFASQRPPVRVLIEDVTKEDNDSRHNGVRFALDHDRTVASEEDPGGGNPTGWSDDQHQDNHKEDQNDQADQQTDCNWNSWYKTFRQENWSHHHPCHVLEAVTWGTAILSGFRFSQFLDPLKDRPQEVPRCWFQQMQRVATSMIKQHLLQFEAGYYSVSTTVKSVLPRGGFSSLPLPSPVAENRDQKLDGKCPVKPSGVFSFGHMRNDASIPLSENVSPEVHEAVKQLPKPSTTTASEVSFTETLSNWGEVLRSVTAAMNNAEGVRLACHGDMEGAIRLWKKAVDEAKSEKAHFNLALAYEQGLGVDKDLDKALEHYSLASLKDHPASLFNSAMIHLRRPLEADKNREIAIKLLEKASELGLKEAQRELGVLYTELPNRDMVRAASLFEKAAAQKDVKSTYFLGVCYENGWGIKLNETMAATLYETAAGAGHAEAQYNLGVFYETGRGGLTCDQRKALELYRLSDGCGCIKARQELKRLEVTLAKDKETHDTSFSRTGSDKKTICSGPQQSKMVPSASRITRLTSSCEADFLSEDSDTESFYLDSVSESSSSEDEALNFTVSQKRVSSASGKSNKLMFGGKKSLRSGIFIGFSSDEETSDSSEVDECTEDRPIKLPLSQLA